MTFSKLTCSRLLAYITEFETRTVMDLQREWGLQWIDPLQHLIRLGIVKESKMHRPHFIVVDRRKYL